jgi:hypothetical protein
MTGRELPKKREIAVMLSLFFVESQTEQKCCI